MALETLVVAVGPNDDARTEELTEAVLDVAAPTGANVVFLHVFSEQAYQAGIEEAGFDPDDPPSPDELASRLEAIDSMAAELGEADVPYGIEGRIGDEADAILEAATDVDADVLYVSGRKRSPTGKAVFGSTVHRLLMDSPCPVLFVREGLHGDWDGS
ncbi:universal stress protein [Natronomonas sp. LN261]|jgi:nucleotide-binding universal stress UspA family protein|uniref:universal stress protein n=1 Tax=Natronomonas sp. LN261 TaxID=2750669 RepID=UPI0015EF9B32|nr:universal stress protein [Natronomonas sp. LN261]